MQHNGKIVKKSVFFTRKLDFLIGKSAFWTRKLFDEKTAFPRTQPQHTLKFLCQIFPTTKQGFPFLHSRICQAPFSYGDPRMEIGTRFFKSPYGNGDSPFPYRDDLILVSIWGSPYGNVFGGQNFWRCDDTWCVTQLSAKTTVPVSIRGVPHIETCRPTKEFPFGDSPFPNRVCAHIGINIYLFIGPTQYSVHHIFKWIVKLRCLFLTNSLGWHPKLIAHVKSWDLQLFNGIGIGGSGTKSS